MKNLHGGARFRRPAGGDRAPSGALQGLPHWSDYPIVIVRMLFLSVSFLLVVSATSTLAAPRGSGTAPTCRCATTPEALLESVDHIFIGDILELKGGGE